MSNQATRKMYILDAICALRKCAVAYTEKDDEYHLEKKKMFNQIAERLEEMPVL